MSKRAWVCLAVALGGMIACTVDGGGPSDGGEPDVAPIDATSEPPMDAGKKDARDATADAMPDVDDASDSDALDAGAEADSDAALEGTPCSPPNTVDQQSCSFCGTQFRGCLDDSDGGFTWGPWGYCTDQVVGGCDPQTTYPDLACGNCGTQQQVCLPNCTFDQTQPCTEPLNACTPNLTEYSLGLSCDAGARPRTCDTQCQWGNWGACGAGVTPVTGRLAAGYYHTCGVNKSGQLKCWGYNNDGQLGNNSTSDSHSPVTVNLANVTDLGLGFYSSCAVVSGGNAYCWGWNTSYGQVGDGTFSQRLVPTAVSNITTAVHIDTGYSHACAVLANGTVQCWGGGFDGQIGNGTSGTYTTPQTVNNITTATGITTGIYENACAVLSGGTVSCWGWNGDGQNGDGTTTNDFSPVTAFGLSNAVQVTGGYFHTCAVRADASVACWGYGYYGNLGDGILNNNSTVPVAATLGNVVQVAAGYGHTCVLTITGEVDCVGYGSDGQMGNGTTTYQNASWITAIPYGAVEIAAGYYHTCALLSNDTVECWGANFDGQIGDGTTVTRKTPTLVVGF